MKSINNNWTIFLDRDGVINHEKKDDYIRHWNEFVFYDSALEAIKILSNQFKKTFIVTNQKGVGKGWMSLDDLRNINNNLLTAVQNAGGHIDKIYFCTDTDENSPNRKPNTGMGLQAKNDFPEIDFEKSIMIGNTLSDMDFGKRLGMKTIFVKTTRPETPIPHPLIDFAFDSLLEASKALINQ